MVGTALDAEWDYTPAAVESQPDYEALQSDVLSTLIDTFAGPADVGVFR